MAADPNTAPSPREMRECADMFPDYPDVRRCLDGGAAEIERLRLALEDVYAAQPIWNGGIAKHRPEYLYGFIEELREIAREGLKNG
jgi:hypothetical protein